MNKFLQAPAGLGTSHRILFAQRLSTFLRAGVPILEALALIEEGAGKEVHRVLARIRNLVKEGHSLSESCERTPRTFDPFSIALIRIGETSGTLHESLGRVATTLTSKNRLRKKIVSALIYPGIVVIATLGIAGFLAGFAFPKIVPLFRGFKATLPISTRILIAITDLVSKDWLLLLISAAILCIGCMLALRNRRVRRARDFLLLRLPVVGTLFQAHYLAELARSFETMLGSGVRILPALEHLKDAAVMIPYEEALHRAARDVEQGARLSLPLRREKRLFPLSFVQLVETGERTGTLVQNFRLLAEEYEEELDACARTLATLIEPILMLFMGIMVGFIALAIITPIYRITQDISIH